MQSTNQLKREHCADCLERADKLFIIIMGVVFQEKAAEQINLEEVKMMENFADLEIMERDSLFDFLHTNGYVLWKRKIKRTANSNEHCHKLGNLIRGFQPTGLNQ